MEKVYNVLALDLGVATGVVYAQWEQGDIEPGYRFKLLAPAERGPAAWDYYLRWIEGELDYYGQCDANLDLLVIEGLAFGASNAVDQARLDTLVRLAAFRRGIPVLSIGNARVKKWAYGKTKDPHSDAKQEVRSRAEREWGSQFITNDHLADAGFLAQIGFYYLAGLTPQHVHRRDVLRDLWKERDEAAALLADKHQAEADKRQRAAERQAGKERRDREAQERQARAAERKQNAQNKRDEAAARAQTRAAKAKPSRPLSEAQDALL